jgi:hypothetical protein
MSREWPPRDEIGIRVVAVGNRVVKTRGDHAPLVMTSRVHGTVNYGELEKRLSYRTGLTLSLRAILAYTDPIQHTLLLRYRQRPRRIMHLHASLLTSR